MNFDDVCRALESGRPLPVVEVVSALLRVCRSRIRDLADRLDPPRGRALYLGMLRSASTRVESMASRGETLSAGDLALLAAFLRERDRDAPLAAHALAAALDDRFGHLFYLHFLDQRLELRPDDPVPVPQLDLRDLFGGGLTPDPDRLEVPPELAAPYDGTRHLRLVPREVAPHRLKLDTREAERLRLLDPLSPSTIFAAIVPSARVSDDFRWDPHEEDGGSYFRDVRPRDPLRYGARLMRLLAAADAAGATVGILPELSVDHRLEDEIVTWFRRTAKHLRLLVAGSRHRVLAPDAPRRNESRLLIRGVTREHRHRKYSNSVFEGRTEYIDRVPAEITITASDSWSVTSLICKDLLESHARRVIADLRVSLVAVAACSPKTTEFADLARALVSEGQCTVLLANTPHGASDHTAILARPTLSARKSIEVLDREEDGIVILFEARSNSYKTAP